MWNTFAVVVICIIAFAVVVAVVVVTFSIDGVSTLEIDLHQDDKFHFHS